MREKSRKNKKGKYMQTFEEILNIAKRKPVKNEIEKMEQELNREIVEVVKTLGPEQAELRKELNKDRIKALGLKLVQGGKA